MDVKTSKEVKDLIKWMKFGVVVLFAASGLKIGHVISQVQLAAPTVDELPGGVAMIPENAPAAQTKGETKLAAPVSENDKATAMWLARSCIGESGWNSADDPGGECAAIMHVYKKRAAVSGVSLLTAAKQYSAAIKMRESHPHKWLFGINRRCDKPTAWPANLVWEKHRDLCLDAMALADAFVAGDVPDPVPDADHFGGGMDAHRALNAGWFELPTTYRNHFYSVEAP